MSRGGDCTTPLAALTINWPVISDREEPQRWDRDLVAGMTFSHTQVMLTRPHELTLVLMRVPVRVWVNEIYEGVIVSWKKFSLFRHSAPKPHLPIPKTLTLNFVTWNILNFKWYKIILKKRMFYASMTLCKEKKSTLSLFPLSIFLQSTLKMKSNFSEILMLTSLATSSYISNI